MSTVAIIGSGMGGLVAGNLLAKKGHKVTKTWKDTLQCVSSPIHMQIRNQGPSNVVKDFSWLFLKQ